MDFKNILAKFDAVDNTAKVKSIAQPSKKDAMQSILESFDRVAEAAKPDFLDLDKDGDKKEPMAKAAKDKEDAKESVEESIKVGDTVKPTRGPHKGVPHEVIHDFGDGHYNVKPKGLSPKQIRYSMGAAKAHQDDLLKEEDGVNEGSALSPRYIKHLQLALRNWEGELSRSETRQLEDILNKLSIADIKKVMNSDIPHLSQMAKIYLRNKTPGGMIKYNESEVQSSDVELEEAIMVSAEGSEAEALLQILKLSGMPAPAAMPAIAAPAADLDTMDIEMQDEYSNSPDEFEQDVDAVIANGTDLHREKGQYPATAPGDNPMNAFEGKFKAILADLLKE